MLPFIDTHAHLPKLDERGIPSVPTLDQLRNRGFGGIIDIGTTAGDLGPRLRMYEGYRAEGFVRFSAGLWPSAEAIADRDRHMDLLRADLDSAPPETVVALGECGIDRHWNSGDAGVDPHKERELFEAQLGLAAGRNLPVIVHSRESARETADAIGACGVARGVVHCFSYGKEEAARFLDLGFHISFAGNCTYKNSADLRATLRYIPEDRLLLETDCPYLAPVPHRGKPAEPGMVELVYSLAAELRGVPLRRLVEAVADNSRALFGFPGRSGSTRS